MAPPSSPAGCPVTASRTRVFSGCPGSVRDARAWVAGFLLGSPAADDAALMVSELFTNAVLYSRSRLPGGQVTVRAEVGGGSIRVEVIDQGAAAPGAAAPPGLGTGLAIVAELADECGTDGRSRWFLLRNAGASMTAVTARPGLDVLRACAQKRPREVIHAILEVDARIGDRGPLCGVTRLAGQPVCGE